MSYARFGDDSHVYVYAGGIGYACCGCWLFDGKSQEFRTVVEIIEHLYTHESTGHKVPSYTFVELGMESQKEHIIDLLDDQILAAGPLERYSASFQISEIIRKHIRENAL
jgi:hypothetical protein